jgi:hypothetical protein
MTGKCDLSNEGSKPRNQSIGGHMSQEIQHRKVKGTYQIKEKVGPKLTAARNA